MSVLQERFSTRKGSIRNLEETLFLAMSKNFIRRPNVILTFLVYFCTGLWWLHKFATSTLLSVHKRSNLYTRQTRGEKDKLVPVIFGHLLKAEFLRENKFFWSTMLHDKCVPLKNKHRTLAASHGRFQSDYRYFVLITDYYLNSLHIRRFQESKVFELFGSIARVRSGEAI